MNIIRKSLSPLMILLTILTISLLATVSVASAESATASTPTTGVVEDYGTPPPDAPAYDPAVPGPGPGDLTWEDLEERESSEGSVHLAPQSGDGPTLMASAGSCTIDTRHLYKRASGSGYPYGAVGGKPKTTCSTSMRSIHHSTTMYKTVWWGLQKVGGPFQNAGFGASSYEQKTVLVPCTSTAYTTYRMEVASTGTFLNGQVAKGYAYQTAYLPCGTP